MIEVLKELLEKYEKDIEHIKDLAEKKLVYELYCAAKWFVQAQEKLDNFREEKNEKKVN